MPIESVEFESYQMDFLLQTQQDWIDLIKFICSITFQGLQKKTADADNNETGWWRAENQFCSCRDWVHNAVLFHLS